MRDTKKGWQWFQFKLRTLIAVLTVAAVGFSWLAYERRNVSTLREAIRAVETLEGTVRFDAKNHVRPKWLRYLVGDDLPGEVVEVGIGGFDATAEQFVPLKRFRRLEKLSLMFVRIDPKIADLSGLVNLRELDIRTDETTDAILENVADMPHLNTLHVHGDHVTGEGLAYVSQLPELKGLYLEAPIRNAALKHITGLQSLRELDLLRSDVTDEGLAYVGQLTQLESLRLNGLTITDRGLERLQNLTKLQTLFLRYCPGVTDDGLKYLANMKQLEYLEVGPSISDAGLTHLAGLTKLKDVGLWQTPVTDEGVAKLKRSLLGTEIGVVGPPIPLGARVDLP